MKRTIILTALILTALSSMSQISIWTSSMYKYQPYYFDEETQEWVIKDEIRDTITASLVSAQYNYNEVDSITFPYSIQYLRKVDNKPVADTLLTLKLWKNGKRFGNDTIIDNFSYSLINSGLTRGIYIKNQTLDELYSENVGVTNGGSVTFLDSIVWHPYSIESLRHSLPDTIYLHDARKCDGDTIVCNIMPEPYYANYNVTISQSDPTIAQIDKIVQHPQDFIYGMGNLGGTKLKITPLNMGTTDITIKANKHIIKHKLTVLDFREKTPEELITLDALFEKIYDRMVQTGDIQPAGKGDINCTDEGVSSYYRVHYELQEFPSDLLWWIWADPGVKEIRAQQWDASNSLINGIFKRLYYNIYLCNQYLKMSDEQSVTSSVSTQAAEVRFIRAFLYSQLLDLFGNVQIITDNQKMFSTPQSTRAEVYDFVVKELKQSELDLPTKRASLYRVDKTAAHILLSRVLLNSEVYVGKKDFTEAAYYAKKAIDSQYELATNYRYLFMGDNDSNGAENEIVWSLYQEGKQHMSYGGSMFLVAAFEDGGMPDWGCSANWRCFTSKSNLPKLFYTNPRSVNCKGGVEVMTECANDSRALFVNYIENGYNDFNFGHDGTSDFYDNWAIQKWTNLMVQGHQPTDPEWPDTDIPLLRLAEAYLNYAEAVLRGGDKQGDLTALQAVNAIRKRAGTREWETVELEQMIDEWGREFYAEGVRRTQLIRFNRFLQSNVAQHFTLYPIPQDAIRLNPNLKQNEGY